MQVLKRQDFDAAAFHADLAQRFQIDPSWTIRQSALELLPLSCDEILDAADDPHWRVRHTLVELLAECQGDEPRRQMLARLRQQQARSGQPQRVAGVIGFLEYLWGGSAAGAGFTSRTADTLPLLELGRRGALRGGWRKCRLLSGARRSLQCQRC